MQESAGGKSSVVMVRNAGLCQRVEEKDANNYVFSLKVFLNCWLPELLRDAVQTSTLADDKVEVFI